MQGPTKRRLLSTERVLVEYEVRVVHQADVYSVENMMQNSVFESDIVDKISQTTGTTVSLTGTTTPETTTRALPATCNMMSWMENPEGRCSNAPVECDIDADCQLASFDDISEDSMTDMTCSTFKNEVNMGESDFDDCGTR